MGSRPQARISTGDVLRGLTQPITEEEMVEVDGMGQLPFFQCWRNAAAEDFNRRVLTLLNENPDEIPPSLVRYAAYVTRCVNDGVRPSWIGDDWQALAVESSEAYLGATEETAGLGIVDTACNKTVHGRRWREHMERKLAEHGLFPVFRASAGKINGIGGKRR